MYIFQTVCIVDLDFALAVYLTVCDVLLQFVHIGAVMAKCLT